MTLSQLAERANSRLGAYAKSIQATAATQGIPAVEAILYANFDKEALVGLGAAVVPVSGETPIRYRIRFHAKMNNFFLDYGGLDPATSPWTLSADMQYHNPILSGLDAKDPYFDAKVILAINEVYSPLIARPVKEPEPAVVG